MNRSIVSLVPVLLAAAAIGCNSSSSHREGGAFPFTMDGTASNVVACAEFDVSDGDAVFVSLQGSSLELTVEPIQNDCEASFVGFGTIQSPTDSAAFNFTLEVADSCDTIQDVDFDSATDFALLTSQAGGPTVNCITRPDNQGAGVLDCEVGGCSFEVVNPTIGVQFDYEDAILDALA